MTASIDREAKRLVQAAGPKGFLKLLRAAQLANQLKEDPPSAEMVALSRIIEAELVYDEGERLDVLADMVTEVGFAIQDERDRLGDEYADHAAVFSVEENGTLRAGAY